MKPKFDVSDPSSSQHGNSFATKDLALPRG
jgi:hypothetical protein